jgi:hypothetical protein
MEKIMKASHLIIAPPSSRWHTRLERIRQLFPLPGKVIFLSPEDALIPNKVADPPAVILVESAKLRDAYNYIHDLCKIFPSPSSYVLVLTEEEDPDWEDAREIFRAGASDVVPYTRSDHEIFEIITQIAHA